MGKIQIPIHVFLKTLISYYQIPILSFLIDIDPIFKIFRNIRRIFRISRSASSPMFHFFRFPDCWYFQKQDFRNLFWVFWVVWSNLVCPKLNISGFGGYGHVHQVRKPWRWWLLGLSLNEIEKLLVHNEATQFYRAFGPLLVN